ncbi:MAG: glucosyltransferase domain-containing protein [Lachnospiraceae bacterium]|nr:glucosyltransferase domain-containing protein [Lachnospiraceae bacterium]
MDKTRKEANARGGGANLKQSWVDFAGFVKSRPMLAGGMAAILALVYAGQAFSNYFYIDKEQLVNNPGSFYNWNEIGRFGLIFVKKIFNLSWYNPYLSGILLLVTLWLSAMAAGYLFYSVDSWFGSAPLGIFILLFLIYPTYVDQFLFQYQAFEVMLAVFFLLVSNWYLVRAVREQNRVAFAASIPLVVVAYGIYQNMVSIQMCLYLGIFLLMLYDRNAEKNIVRTLIVQDILHFVITLAGYAAIAMFFWKAEGNYLGEQIGWSRGIFETLRSIFYYFGLLVVSDGVYYTRAYVVCCLIGIISLILLVKRLGRKAFWYALGLAGVAVSPLFMSILMGGLIVPRIQMTLPLANAILWLFGFRVVCTEGKEHWKGGIRALAVLVGGILILMNAAPTMRMFYTRDVIGKADEMTTTVIVKDLGAFPASGAGKPIIFWGHREALTNPVCSEPDRTHACVFISAYEVQYFFEPKYFFSTYRIIGYWKTLGYDWFCGPTAEMMPLAYEHGADMPAYPCTGYIKEFDDYIIIKLGEE